MEFTTQIINFNEVAFHAFLQDRNTANFHVLTEEGHCYNGGQRNLYISKAYIPGQNLAVVYTHDTGSDFETNMLYYTNDAEFVAVYSQELNTLIFKKEGAELNLPQLCKSIRVLTVEGIGARIVADAEVEFDSRYPELKAEYASAPDSLDDIMMQYSSILENEARTGKQSTFKETTRYIDPIYHINYKYDYHKILTYLKYPVHFIKVYCNEYFNLDYGYDSVIKRVQYRAALEQMKEEIQQNS